MTRSFILASAFAAAALSAAPTVAAGSGSTQVTGSLAPSCNIVAPPAATFDPSLTSQQSIGSARYRCNFTGATTLAFWSQNGGSVVMSASSQNGNVVQSRAFSLLFDGTALGVVSNSSASASVASRNVTAVGVEQLGELKIQLATAANVAGSYADTIFMSINP